MDVLVISWTPCSCSGSGDEGRGRGLRGRARECKGGVGAEHTVRFHPGSRAMHPRCTSKLCPRNDVFQNLRGTLWVLGMPA